MKFSIVIDSDDDACMQDPTGEARSALFVVRALLTEGRTEGLVYDANGNRIGEWHFRPDS